MADTQTTTPPPTAAVQTKRAPQPRPDKPKPKPLPRWNVVLVDDDDHTYDYVIEMLINLFGHSLQQGLRLARSVDRDGRATVFTTHQELAELKREQIVGFGLDPRLASSRRGMRAVIEPAD